MTTGDYIEQVKGVLDNLDVEDIDAVIAALQTARAEGNRIFIMGNGGSAATASHIAGDLMKSCGGWGQSFVMCLNDNVTALTAWANDDGYSGVFANLLIPLLAADDVVVVLSGSGRSADIIAALDVARAIPATSVALLGQAYNIQGGMAAEMADVSVVVPSDNMEIIEDVHLMIGHMIKAAMLEPARTEG